MAWAVLLFTVGVGDASGGAVADAIRNRLERPGALRVGEGNQLLHARRALSSLYERRLYEAAWSREGRLRPISRQLVAIIDDAESHGLAAVDYHRDAIEAALGPRRIDSDGVLADVDLLLSDALLVYASHLLAGRVNPITIDSEWFVRGRDGDAVGLVESVFEGKALSTAVAECLPRHEGYRRLREALARFRAAAAAGGWSAVTGGETLKPGAVGDRVEALRERLEASGDLAMTPEKARRDSFDVALEAGVRRFQERHGLVVDGSVGTASIAALDVPIETRMRQLAVNLERWRWLPQDLGGSHVAVNIPAFELRVVEGRDIPLTMRVIVGRAYRRTPVFSDRITHLVFNPYWHVPHSIATQDLVPAAKKDPEYLSRLGIRVFSGGREIDPSEIDWAAVGAGGFPYRLRQDPGPKNALGRVKFMFPNPHNVYLHDTPARELFARASRSFSSGCIRIERPVDLAAYLLRGAASGDEAALTAAFASSVERTVYLDTPMPIHILYWTAWVDEHGALQLRDDLYKRDQPVSAALREPASAGRGLPDAGRR